MKLVLIAIAGAALFLGSVWAGAWAIGTYPNHWSNFPAFVSAALGCFAGVAVVILGCDRYLNASLGN